MESTVFEQALSLLRRSGMEQVRLLGGEPTLHPAFPQFVERIVEQDMRLLVFSNGLMPEHALQCLETLPENRLSLLVNVNPPETSTHEEQKRQAEVFERLQRRVQLGMNISIPGIDLNYVVELAQRFPVSREVRLGLAHPCTGGDNEFLHPRHYHEVGHRIVALAAEAQVAGIKMSFDCGFVPCMFISEKRVEWDDQERVLATVGRQCGPIPDILPDGQAIHCYPLAALARVSATGATDVSQLRDTLKRTMEPYRVLGVFRECGDCAFRQAGQCHGGCLAAALMQLRARSTKPSSTRGRFDGLVWSRSGAVNQVRPASEQEADCSHE